MLIIDAQLLILKLFELVSWAIRNGINVKTYRKRTIILVDINE